MGEPLAAAMAVDPQPAAGRLLFEQMMRDITGGGGCADPMGQARAADVAERFDELRLGCGSGLGSRSGAGTGSGSRLICILLEWGSS